MDQAWLERWRGDMRAGALRFTATFQSRYGFAPGEHIIADPVPGVAGFSGVVGRVSLPDLGNGWFLESRDDPHSLTDGRRIAVFGSDGGGDYLALELPAGAPVLRLQEGAMLDGVYDAGHVTVVAADLQSFLDSLRSELLSASPATAREVFLALVHGVAAGRGAELAGLYAEQTDVLHPFDPLRAPAVRTRSALREHFGPPGSRPPRQVTNVRIHETADPEVIVAEFEYRSTASVQPAIFVLRVRDGLIVESRDYFDYLTTARTRGELPGLLAALPPADET